MHCLDTFTNDNFITSLHRTHRNMWYNWSGSWFRRSIQYRAWWLGLDGVTEEEYNKAINKANKVYCKRMHNICCDNCHSHVANALNHLKYKGRDNYTMIDVWWMCTWKSRYVSHKHLFCTYIGFVIIALIFSFAVIMPTVFNKKWNSNILSFNL